MISLMEEEPQYLRGFTLIELIIVIVLLSIVGIFTFSYIAFGTRIYTDAVEREQLISQSRFAVGRLTLELRNALPRSVRYNEDDNFRCIEFMPIVTSSNYLQMPRPGVTANDDFIAMRPIRLSNMVDNYLIVYPSNLGFIYGADSQRRKRITAVNDGEPESGLITIEFTGSTTFFPTDSPARRFYVTTSPVSWCYNESLGQIERYSGYPLSAGQPTLASLRANYASNGEVMAINISNNMTNGEFPFSVVDATLQRSSLVQFDLRLRRGSSNEPLQILHEVHIPNVP